jgi:hypothetical protein
MKAGRKPVTESVIECFKYLQRSAPADRPYNPERLHQALCVRCAFVYHTHSCNSSRFCVVASVVVAGLYDENDSFYVSYR